MMLKGPRLTRSYEEVEKRRSELITGVQSRSRGAAVLLIMFLAFATITLYLLFTQLIGVAPADFMVPEATALLATGSLLGYRIASRRRGGEGSVGSALLDAAIFSGLIGLAVGTCAFPLIDPLPEETSVIGVYSLVLIAAMILVLRFTQTGRGRPENT